MKNGAASLRYSTFSRNSAKLKVAMDTNTYSTMRRSWTRLSWIIVFFPAAAGPFFSDSAVATATALAPTAPAAAVEGFTPSFFSSFFSGLDFLDDSSSSVTSIFFPCAAAIAAVAFFAASRLCLLCSRHCMLAMTMIAIWYRICHQYPANAEQVLVAAAACSTTSPAADTATMDELVTA